MTAHTFNYTARDCRVAAETLGEHVKFLIGLVANIPPLVTDSQPFSGVPVKNGQVDAGAIYQRACADEAERAIRSLTYDAAHFARRAMELEASGDLFASCYTDIRDPRD